MSFFFFYLHLEKCWNQRATATCRTWSPHREYQRVHGIFVPFRYQGKGVQFNHFHAHPKHGINCTTQCTNSSTGVIINRRSNTRKSVHHIFLHHLGHLHGDQKLVPCIVQWCLWMLVLFG